ncbi:Stk1 family PASTA domain-containing Ser/Thr kinase [Streptomyces sp. RFCAC02]|uniref:Stk1 family PASTA domain-containing Ser/Thr kinase n=1 Tax=Streptomyces sp. RFCAC02 TaxID=2499143 RepID=UPI0010207351|nr:Stk1 family PASTA domain-containing Ser/Thr kinase [Streptomyces sp. RFCAC02]
MEEPRRLGGRYELGQVLGRGGMAEVYLAHDTRLGRTVAVKTLRVDLARDPTFQARFRREAQSAASLNHPAIVAVYDTGEDYVDGISIPYIVMEYVDGSTLRELLHSGRKLLPERSLEMCIGILQALEYSHRNGIVHRDIKPANVMLTRTGQVKVMDFGIARAMGDAGMTMTQTAAVIGTAQYLSPEQAKGETVDARSDLYSTGCLLYELLTVRPPFIGDSPVAVAYQHVREEPQPPSVFDPEITPDTDAIVLKALVKDPDYRYQSADEMRADIEAALDGRPVGAAVGLGSVPYGYDDRPTTALRATDPGTTMMPPADGGDGYDSYDDYGGRADRRQRRRNTSTILLVIAAVLVLIGAIFIGRVLFSGDSPEAKVTVPDVAGQSEEDATAALEDRGFAVTTGEPVACEEDEGLACRTDPAEGEELDKGAQVTLFLSAGPEDIEVPDLSGMSWEDAEAALTDAGLESTKETEETDDEEPGTVLDQDPEAGEMIQPGEEVTVTVAVEPDEVTVPDVVGMQYDAAVTRLEQDDFTAAPRYEETSDYPEGQVIAQDPQANDSYQPGGQVTLTVAKAPEQPETVNPPNVTNQLLSTARDTLTSQGFTVRVEGPDTATAMVMTQSPDSTQQVEPGSEIVLRTYDLGGGQDGGQDGGGDNGGNNGNTILGNG